MRTLIIPLCLVLLTACTIYRSTETTRPGNAKGCVAQAFERQGAEDISVEVWDRTAMRRRLLRSIERSESEGLSATFAFEGRRFSYSASGGGEGKLSAKDGGAVPAALFAAANEATACPPPGNE